MAFIHIVNHLHENLLVGAIILSTMKWLRLLHPI